MLQCLPPCEHIDETRGSVVGSPPGGRIKMRPFQGEVACLGRVTTLMAKARARDWRRTQRFWACLTTADVQSEQAATTAKRNLMKSTNQVTQRRAAAHRGHSRRVRRGCRATHFQRLVSTSGNSATVRSRRQKSACELLVPQIYHQILFLVSPTLCG